MDDIKLYLSNDSMYTFESNKMIKNKELCLKIIKKKNKHSEELLYTYDEEKKMKLKILNTVNLSSKFKTVNLLINKFLAINHLYIRFKKVDETILEKFISMFNSFKSFSSLTSTLKIIELNFEDCRSQNLHNTDINKIYDWENLNRLLGPADRQKIICIKSWNLEKLNNLNKLINISNYLEFYLSCCQLKINNEANISIQVKEREIKMITDNFNISIYKDLIEDKLLCIRPYDIKIAKSFIQESFILYMDLLEPEEKKDYIRTKVLNACTQALKNYIIDKESNIQFDFCSIKVVLECPDNSNEILENLFEEYKNIRVCPEFYEEQIDEENNSRKRYQNQSETLSKCKLEINNQYITPSNLVIILSLGTIVNEMRFNNCTLVLQSYDDLNQYLNFGGQINLKILRIYNCKFLLFYNKARLRMATESYSLNNLVRDNACKRLSDLLFKTKLIDSLESICILDPSNTLSSKLKELVVEYNHSN